MKHIRHPMHRIIEAHASMIGRATLQGRLYDLGAYPGVVPSEDPGERVQGEAYLIRNEGALLTPLDAYEGYRPEEEGSLYRRVEAPITFAEGHQLVAWVYCYNGSIEGKHWIVDGRYRS